MVDELEVELDPHLTSKQVEMVMKQIGVLDGVTRVRPTEEQRKEG